MECAHHLLECPLRSLATNTSLYFTHSPIRVFLESISLTPSSSLPYPPSFLLASALSIPCFHPLFFSLNFCLSLSLATSLSLLKFSSCSCQTSLFFALFSYIDSPVPDLSLSQNHSHHSLLLSLSLKSSPAPITHFLSTMQSLSLPLSSFSSLFLPLMHLCSSVLSHFLNFSSSLLWDHSHPLYFPLSLSLSLSLTFFFCLDFQLPLQFCPLYS